MAENPKGPKKPGDDDPGVLSGLSTTRPSRIGGRRRDSATSAPNASNGASKKAAASPKKSASKGKAGSKRKTESGGKAAGMPRRRTTGAAQEVREPDTPRKPRPVRAGSPALEAAAPDATAKRPGARTAPPPPPASVPNAPEMPSGTQLVTTAIQAAGELAQIGVTVGGQIVKRAIDRLPKP